MGSECNEYYSSVGIEFTSEYQDSAVYYTRSDPDLTWDEKKALITCWFDTTYGNWNGFRYNLNDSRTQMSLWLKHSKYASFEQFLQEDF